MKKVVAAITVLFLASAGIVLGLPLALGSDSLRTVLARQLSAASGVEISLAGPVRFSVIPDFGIVADDLAYASGDGSVAVAARRAVASVRLMSLFSDRIRITGIDLEAPHITLSKDHGGEADGSAEPAAGGDVFELAASWLETLAIDHVGIVDGEIMVDDGSGARPAASGIDLSLSVPGLDEAASLAFSGIVGGRKVTLSGAIGSFRDVLDRRPAEFTLAAEMASPPHPLLASLGATGRIQLADDGSYRIADGEITTAGVPMHLDAAYLPGDRPFVTAKIRAGILDHADFAPAAEAAEITGKDGTGPTARSGGLDLSALRNIDVDFELRADAIRAGNAVARGILFQAILQGGRLEATMDSQQISGGQLQSGVFADLNGASPEVSGHVDLEAIDIEGLMALAGHRLPATGRLTSRLQYAFRGTDEAAIRKTINLKGAVAIEEGSVDIPALADIAGPGAGRITAVDAKAEITDIGTPLAVSGTMTWNGEKVGAGGSVALADLLSGKPGAVTVDLRSRSVEAKFSGNVDLDGGAHGRAIVETASLGRLLRWVGQDAGSSLGRFSYAGAITAQPGKLALDDFSIALDDMKAAGSASVATAGKPAITASLSVAALDFAKLTGGGEKGGPSPGSSTPATIDLTVLRRFDADIHLKADQIGYGEVKAGPASATLAVKDGIARLSVPNAGFYDGAVAAEVAANGAGEVPEIEFDARLDGVSALPFLSDAAAFERLEGKLDAGLALKGSGATTDTLARSLAGKARVVFADGAIRGIDVARLVTNLKSLIAGGYQQNEEDRTEFTELSVSYDIADGVARTADLRLLGPFVRMDGSGSVDLAAHSIDMRLNPRVVGSLDGQGSEFDVAGLGLPVIVTGPLSGPRIYPDLTNILADPQAALRTISGLAGGIGNLAAGASDGAGVIEDALGKGAGSLADGVVSEVIGRLGTSTGENAAPGEPQSAASDLVGSLLQGMLGNGSKLEPADQPENQAAPPQLQGALDPETGQPSADPFQEPEPDIAPPTGEGAIVLPSSGVPVPTPNPRRQTSATGAPVAEPAPPESPAGQAAGPAAAAPPEAAPDPATDLIRGLLERMGD